MEKCCICNEQICDAEQTVVLQQKGSDGVNRASAERGIDLRTIPGERVHVDCRRRHCKAENIARDIASQEPPVENRRDLRSLQKPFNFQEHCMFCGQPAKNTEGKRRGFDVFPVRTKYFQDTVIKICHSRNDKWSETVLGRLACVNDLHAADAVYHHQCSCNFRTGRNIPCKSVDDIGDTPKKSKPGRPETNERTAAFLKVTHFLEENDDELKKKKKKKKKKKGMVLYSAVSSPLDRSKRFTLSSPGRPVHSDTALGFSWKHSSHAAIAQRLFTHISTTVYSQVLIYTAESTEAS